MKKVRRRSLAAVLIVALLASMLGIFNFSPAADSLIDIGNHPALRGFVSGTAPSQEFWSYDMKDYGDKAAMQTSDTDFKAPLVNWDVDNEKVTFDWSAVSGAASYTLNVYEGVALADSFAGIAVNTYSKAFSQTNLVTGTDYEAQVVAYDASGSVISASCVRKFSAAAKPQYAYAIQDFNNVDASAVYAVREARNNALVYNFENGMINITTTHSSNAVYFKFPYASQTAFKDNTGNANYIYVKMITAPGFGSKTKPGFSTSQNGGKVSAVNSNVTYPKYANIYNVKLPANKISYNVVSVDNPTNTASVPMTSNSMGGYVPYGFDSLENGYYYVIPLSTYDETMRADIKAGTFDVFGLHFETALTYNTATNKYVTTSASAPGKISIDEIGFITDYAAWLSQMQDEYDPAAAEQKTSYAFEGDLGVLNADTFSASQDTLSNAKFGSFYKFQSDTTARRVTFTAVSSFTNQYGANLTFTADKAGYYDLANRLEVVNNDSVTDATINYRVVKRKADGSQEIVYPYDTATEKWYSFRVSADNKNPVGKIAAPMVYLAEGEKLVIETYADIPAGGKLEINLGNPTVTPVGYSENYKGSTYTWSYGNYVPFFVYDGGSGQNAGGVGNSSFQQTGRWTEKLLEIDPVTGNEKYIEFPTHNMGWGLTGKRSSPYAGFYYYTATNRQQEMKIETSAGRYGVSFLYTAPISGSATLSFSGSTTFKYRIKINDEQAFPASGWDVSANISSALNLNAGDVVTLDIIKRDDDAGKTITCVSPKIIMSSGNLSNSVGDHTFAPLWERPYAGKSYKGKFAHIDGSIWNFQTSDFSSLTAIKSYDANYYDSSDKSLYYKDGDGKVNPDAKYIFADEQLKAVLSAKNHGISLTFTAPTIGYYDFSTAINLLDGTFNAVNGAGALKVRVLAGGETVWPAGGDWYTVSKIKIGTSIDIDATEVSLGAGETIVLQIYPSTMVVADGSETADPMVIGLGSPAVQHVETKVFTSTGNTTIYQPSDFTVMEKGYSGEYIPVDSRFNYSIGGKAPATTDTATHTLTVDKDNKIVFNPDTGTTSLVIGAGKTAKVDFTSPMSGSGAFDIAAAAVSGVQFRILKNGKAIKDWADTLPATTAITAEKGDVFTLEVKSTKNATVALDGFNISLSGVHNNPNSAADNAFYASFAVPYGDDKYIGAFKESKDSFWKFRMYDVASGEVKSADYYDFNDGKHLYNTNMQKVGYYFTNNNNALNGNIYSSDTENYGLSLEFVSPNDNTYNYRSGMQITTAGASATVFLRLIQETTDGDGKSVTKTIYPADTDSDGWAQQTVGTYDDVYIPYAELSLKKGDVVRLQVYAKDSSANTLAVTFASPGLVQDNVTVLEHADVGAHIYNPASYRPYAHFEGKMTNFRYVPMENRWNCELVEIDPEGGNITDTFYADTYNIGSIHELLYKGTNQGKPWLNYQFGTPSSPTSVVRYTSGNSTVYRVIGSSKRFIAPATNEYELNAITPKISNIIPGGSVRYRIIKVSAATGAETTVWPNADVISTVTDASGGVWESIGENAAASEIAAIGKMKLELEVGDQLLFQIYGYADKETLDTWIEDTQPTDTKWSYNAGLNPYIILYDYVTEKSIHALNTGWMHDYQLSPYWKIQSADGDGQPYRDNTRYSWNYWLDTKYSLIGISAAQKWNFQKYKENTWTDEIKPIISARFTFATDGYLSTKGAAKFIGNHFVDEAGTKPVNIKARILLNGENVYPTSGWSNITNGTTFSYDVKGIAVKAGDELRYELMYDNGGQNVYISWNPTLTISKYADIYNYTDDIYNVLTDEMTAHFKGLKSKVFQADSSIAKALSEAIKARKEAAAEIGPVYSGLFDDSDDGNDEIISGDSGDYREWIEEIYTPGKGQRRIIRRTVVSWWIIALIIAGGVVLLAGITVLTIILVKKKRKKSANKA